MKLRNPNRRAVRENMSRIPEETLTLRMSTLIAGIPEIRPKSFKECPLREEFAASFVSVLMKVVILVRRLNEDAEHTEKIRKSVNNLSDSGFLCISVFPQALEFDRQKLAKRIMFEVFQHVKGKNIK